MPSGLRAEPQFELTYLHVQPIRSSDISQTIEASHALVFGDNGAPGADWHRLKGLFFDVKEAQLANLLLL